MMSRGCVSHLHGVELDERTTSDATQKHLTRTNVAGSRTMARTACAPSNSIDVLIGLGGVLCKVNARAKHTTDVGVTFVKPTSDNGVEEWRTVEEEALVIVADTISPAFTPIGAAAAAAAAVATSTILGYLSTPMHIPLPHPTVTNASNFQDV
uniref:Uncharacterized protein n=1 Tax=Hydatigena taeniaeformis TaxID=6205 RepID=A0A0R3WQE1_HYDTA